MPLAPYSTCREGHYAKALAIRESLERVVKGSILSDAKNLQDLLQEKMILFWEIDSFVGYMALDEFF